MDELFKKNERKIRKLFDTRLLAELLYLNYEFNNKKYHDDISICINKLFNDLKNKKILINLIKKYTKGNKLIESGSGTGVLLTHMASIGYDVTGIDIDKDILSLSKKIAKSYNSKTKPTFKNKSIFELDYRENYFDVSFSNGVLEHFNDEQIIDTLKQQMKIAKIVIFGIPTKHFNQEEAMYGDERYKSNKFWRNLINISGGVILEEKSMHYMSRTKRLLNYKKYFRPYPYRIFVIKPKNNNNLCYNDNIRS